MVKCPHCGEEISEFHFEPLIKFKNRPQAIYGYGDIRQKEKNGKYNKECKTIPVVMVVDQKVEE